ncbi:DUF3515 family protein [Microbacterium sp.]|uniref:DUF3515 family protein n=1 Tax=Microbacterium sp. TaxID=51671 RepID=UPI00262699CD|nr:DUF3515 family protein [Microbacterium sp.]
MGRRFAVASGLVLVAAALSGCTPTVHMEPADDSNNPLCAEVVVNLENLRSLAGQDRIWTDAQGTAAWGASGAAILLTCGLDKPAPTSELQCVTLEGVDWLVDASETPKLRLTTYGREPAVQLYVDTEVVSSNDVISTRGLVGAISVIPVDGACTAPDELDEDAQQLLDG